MAQLQVHTVTSETNHTNTGNTNWNVVDSIGAASIEAADYIVFCSALIGGDTTNVNFEWILHEGNTTIPNSHSKIRPANTYATTNHGQSYGALWKETFGGVSNFNFKQKLTATTTETVHTLRTNMVMIKVDDTDTDTDALWTGDYEMAQLATETGAVTDTWVDLESITIGNGSDDYLIISSARFGTGSTATILYELMVGGVTAESLSRKRLNSGETINESIVTFLAAPATDTIVKTRFQANTSLGDCESNAIVAIRLNAFDDYAGVHDTTPVAIVAADTDYVGATLTHTTAHTSAAAEDWFIIGFSQLDNLDNQKRYEDWMDQGVTTIAGAHNNNTWHYTYDNSDPFSVGWSCMFAERNMANATDLDVDYGHQEEGDVVPNASIEITNIIGFTLEKKPPTTPVGLATETDSTFAVTRGPFAKVVGLAIETDESLAIVFDKNIPVGLSSEADSALQVTTAGLGGPVGLTTETDEALGIIRAGFLEPGLVTETDSAFIVAPRHDLDANRVIGIDTAFSISVGLATAPTIVVETDTALSVGKLKVPPLPIVVETDFANNLASGNIRFPGLAEEADSALNVLPFSEGAVQLVIEIDIPQAVQANKTYPALGLNTESDSAFIVTPVLLLVPADLGWEDNDVTWGGIELSSLDFAPVYIDGMDFKVLGYDGSIALDTFLERKAVVYERGASVLGTGVWPDIIGPSGQAIQIMLGSHDVPEGAVTWEGPYDFVIGEDDFVDFAIAGRYLAIRFESSGVSSWTLQSYDIDYEIVGRH